MEGKSGGAFKTLVALCVLVALLIVLFLLSKDTAAGWFGKAKEAAAEVVDGAKATTAEGLVSLAGKISSPAPAPEAAAPPPPEAAGRYLVLCGNLNVKRDEIESEDDIVEDVIDKDKLYEIFAKYFNIQKHFTTVTNTPRVGFDTFTYTFIYAIDDQATDEQILDSRKDEAMEMLVLRSGVQTWMILEKGQIRVLLENSLAIKEKDGAP